jgi:hypothetical protein
MSTACSLPWPFADAPAYSGTPFFQGAGRVGAKTNYFSLNKREINHLHRNPIPGQRRNFAF